MKLMIDISENYYEILKYDVEHGNDYKPIVLIANGTPLPKGHGRLIDADKLKARIPIIEDEYYNCRCMIEHAPTIIEADKEAADL